MAGRQRGSLKGTPFPTRQMTILGEFALSKFGATDVGTRETLPEEETTIANIFLFLL
jgi:hypothetical protein